MVAVLQRPLRWFLHGPGGNLLSAAARCWPDRRRNTLRVLMYHRVDHHDPGSPLAPCTLSATPEAFAQQMDMLVRDFHPVGLREVLAAQQNAAQQNAAQQNAAQHGHEPLLPRSVLVTFDDAYHCFATQAWPILRQRSIPVVLFVPTAYPGATARVFWWDALHWAIEGHADRQSLETPMGHHLVATPQQRRIAFRELSRQIRERPFADGLQMIESLLAEVPARPPAQQVLPWQTLRQLQAEGVVLAPHTQTHPILDQIPLGDAAREMLDSCTDLQRETSSCPLVLAYPGGFTNAGVADILREQHWDLAFTTRRGANTLGVSDPLHLHRINVSAGSTAAMIRAQLSFPPAVLNSVASFTG